MSKKDEFLKAFKEATGKEAESFKGKAKEFAEAINKHGLQAELRAVIDESKASSSDEAAAAGLSQLFGG